MLANTLANARPGTHPHPHPQQRQQTKVVGLLLFCRAKQCSVSQGDLHRQKEALAPISSCWTIAQALVSTLPTSLSANGVSCPRLATRYTLPKAPWPRSSSKA